MVRRLLLLASLCIANASCGRAPAAGPAPNVHDEARIAIAQEALGKASNGAVCLAVDPTVIVLTESKAVPKDGEWNLRDPAPSLFNVVKRKGLLPASQCPKTTDEDGPYQVSIGPLMVHRSGRVEGKVVYGAWGWPTLEQCVAEFTKERTWVVECKILLQA